MAYSGVFVERSRKMNPYLFTKSGFLNSSFLKKMKKEMAKGIISNTIRDVYINIAANLSPVVWYKSCSR